MTISRNPEVSFSQPSIESVGSPNRAIVNSIFIWFSFLYLFSLFYIWLLSSHNSNRSFKNYDDIFMNYVAFVSYSKWLLVGLRFFLSHSFLSFLFFVFLLQFIYFKIFLKFSHNSRFSNKKKMEFYLNHQFIFTLLNCCRNFYFRFDQIISKKLQ